MLIYAVMGSSKHLVVGPVAVAALLVAAAIAEHAPNYGDAHLADIQRSLPTGWSDFIWAEGISHGRFGESVKPPCHYRVRQRGCPTDHYFPAPGYLGYRYGSIRKPATAVGRFAGSP
jgi:hypothetical protein